MKNYLFDKIRVEEDGKVKFCPFRNPSLKESFMGYTKLTVEYGRWEFVPSSFNEFLAMLKKTKLNDAGEYNITLCVDGKEEKYSFHSLVDYYASKIYMYSPFMHLRTVGRFTTQAYAIKELAAKEQRESIEGNEITID